MLDLQRNLLTALLVAGIAALVAGGVAVAVFMGRPDVASIKARGSGSVIDEQVDAPAPGLDEFSSYAAILEQPVFFSDRKLPVVEALDEDDETCWPKKMKRKIFRSWPQPWPASSSRRT